MDKATKQVYLHEINNYDLSIQFIEEIQYECQSLLDSIPIFMKGVTQEIDFDAYEKLVLLYKVMKDREKNSVIFD